MELFVSSTIVLTQFRGILRYPVLFSALLASRLLVIMPRFYICRKKIRNLLQISFFQFEIFRFKDFILNCFPKPDGNMISVYGSSLIITFRNGLYP